MNRSAGQPIGWNECTILQTMLFGTMRIRDDLLRTSFSHIHLELQSAVLTVVSLEKVRSMFFHVLLQLASKSHRIRSPAPNDAVLRPRYLFKLPRLSVQTLACMFISYSAGPFLECVVLK